MHDQELLQRAQYDQDNAPPRRPLRYPC
jgi:hypothetical protein